MLDIHDPIHNENGLESYLVAVISQLVHYHMALFSHFIAHGFLRIVQAFSLFIFFGYLMLSL